MHVPRTEIQILIFSSYKWILCRWILLHRCSSIGTSTTSWPKILSLEQYYLF